MMNRPPLDSLDDHALLCEFGDLVRQDHQGNALLLRHIDAIDRRRLWARLGHPSMFSFLVNRFHMSESTAGKRIGAARTARRYPVVFGMVARASPAAPAPLPRRRDPDPAPLSPGRYRLQLTLSQSTRDKLEQLRDLLAHQIPNGDPAAIFERAIDALLKQVRQSKIGIADKPRSPKPTTSTRRTRHIQAAVRREVWPRDEGRCGFVGEDGHRCNETRGLEFAHVHPWAKGGGDTADNLGLRCMTHDALEADRDYGTRFMANSANGNP